MSLKHLIWHHILCLSITLTFLIDEGLELDDNSEDSEGSEGSEDCGDNTAEERRPCIDPLCGWSRRQGSIFLTEIKNQDIN